jgi:hypothetical protein
MTKINLEEFLTLDIKYNTKTRSATNFDAIAEHTAAQLRQYLIGNPEALDGDEVDCIADRIRYYLNQLNANI